MQRKQIYIIVAILVLSASALFAVFFNKEKEVVMPLTRSWEKVVPNQKVPQGLVSLKAEDCGTCHAEHYNEWQQSTHAQAWKDLQFQAELKKESSPFMCINCHIPLQNQQEFIVTGLINGDIYKPVKEKNPHFDRELQQEGINCSSCHVRDNMIVGPTGSTLAPHPVKKDPGHLSETLCISCHNANAVITPTLACTFETGDEWKAGPFFGKKNCINCHMPETHRPLMAGFPARKSHFHSFPASGIPKLDTLKSNMLKSLEFYETKIKSHYKVGELINYKLTLKNEHAGHRVPSGDPERFMIIDMTLKDANQKIIAIRKGRIGETWQWFPEAKKLSDNNLYPGEARTFGFEKNVDAKGSYILEINVTKHRISDEAAEYNKLPDNYPRFINIFSKKYPIEVI